jgi:hypothetical protein
MQFRDGFDSVCASATYGKSKLTETEKGETGEEESQEHAHLFFDIKEIV